jgi:hypothetical protein
MLEVAPYRGGSMTIAERNDLARKYMGVACMPVVTCGVASLPPETLTRLIEAVRNFDDFNRDNDPWKEHDFGNIKLDGRLFFWKIDDYGEDYQEQGATHPLVLTIMRAEEY